MTRYKVYKDGERWRVDMHRMGRDEDGKYTKLATTEEWQVALYIATSDPANKPDLTKIAV